MNDIRARFEEIWPVPEGVGWGETTSCYFAWYHMAQEDAIAHTARLDTFTRCQETTEIYVSIIDEMVRHMGIISHTSTDLRAIGIARESVGLAKQKMEGVK